MTNMEIREGLKYKFIDSGVEGIVETIDYEIGNCKGSFLNGFNNHRSDDIDKFIKDFESGKAIITDYPYKVDDYVIVLKTSGTNSEADYREDSLYKVTGIRGKENKTIETVNFVGISNGWAKEYFRPAFKYEIDNYLNYNDTKEDLTPLANLLQGL